MSWPLDGASLLPLDTSPVSVLPPGLFRRSATLVPLLEHCFRFANHSSSRLFPLTAPSSLDQTTGSSSPSILFLSCHRLKLSLITILLRQWPVTRHQQQLHTPTCSPHDPPYPRIAPGAYIRHMRDLILPQNSPSPFTTLFPCFVTPLLLMLGLSLDIPSLVHPSHPEK